MSDKQVETLLLGSNLDGRGKLGKVQVSGVRDDHAEKLGGTHLKAARGCIRSVPECGRRVKNTLSGGWRHRLRSVARDVADDGRADTGEFRDIVSRCPPSRGGG